MACTQQNTTANTIAFSAYYDDSANIYLDTDRAFDKVKRYVLQYRS